jgi:hypothetical protein
MFTTRSPETDASLRRVQRDGVLICAATACLSLLVAHGRPAGALGVLAGGALMAVSFLAIRGGVDAALKRRRPGPGGWAAFRFIARLGVIAVLSWAVLVPLRTDPLGVFAGVTAPVLAIGIEAVRLTRRGRGRNEGPDPSR